MLKVSDVLQALLTYDIGHNAPIVVRRSDGTITALNDATTIEISEEGELIVEEATE